MSSVVNQPEETWNYTPLPEPIPITEQVWPEGTKPLVCTRHMTYNHENYIRDCIEGVLMQKTTFPVRVCIHDDASTDKTAEIVREYQEKYPNLIWAYYQTENTFRHLKRKEMRSEFMSWAQEGKYQAVCEGDDYWIDSLKLQKQVEFLEENIDYTLVECLVVNVDEFGEKIGYSKGGTRTRMFPNGILEKFRIRHKDIIKHGDGFTSKVLQLNGKRHCINEVMAAWRKHDGGVWSTLLNDENLHILENNRGLTKLGIGMTILENGYTKEGIKYIANSINHFLNATQVDLKLKEKLILILHIARYILRKNTLKNTDLNKSLSDVINKYKN